MLLTCPAELSEEKAEEMREYARQGHKLLKLDAYSRLDFMMSGDERIYCLEANTLPGMTPTSLLPQEAAAVGMDFPELCQQILLQAVDRKG